MESRQIDVSRLAELSALGLLAVKVKLALGRAKRAGVAVEGEARRIRGAVGYVDRLLGGLRGLGASAGMGSAGPDQLYAIDSYMTARDAWSRSRANRDVAAPDSDEMRVMEDFLTQIRTQLESALSQPQIEPASVALADDFFAALADYASAQHQEILRAAFG